MNGNRNPPTRSEARADRPCTDRILDRWEAAIYEQDAREARILHRGAPERCAVAAANDKDLQVRTWVLLARTKLLEGDLDRAEECLLRQAAKHLAHGSPESPSFWTALAALHGARGEFSSARSLIADALDFLRVGNRAEVRPGDRYSMAGVVLQSALLMSLEGRQVREVARELLQALFLSTIGTPNIRDAAARHLAVECGKAWIQGDSGLSPGALLRNVRRVRKMIEIEGGSMQTRGMARLHWLEGMTLAAMAQGLTPVAVNKLASAKALLVRLREERDRILVNMDLAYWQMRARRRLDLSANAREILELSVSAGCPAGHVESLRRWVSSMEEEMPDEQVTAEVFRNVRGVSLPRLQHNGRSDHEVDRPSHRWYSPTGW